MEQKQLDARLPADPHLGFSAGRCARTRELEAIEKRSDVEGRHALRHRGLRRRLAGGEAPYGLASVVDAYVRAARWQMPRPARAAPCATMRSMSEEYDSRERRLVATSASGSPTSGLVSQRLQRRGSRRR